MENNKDIVCQRFTIKFCDGAQKSLDKVIKKIAPTGKRKTVIASIFALLRRMADGNRLASDSLVEEGNLPNGKNFKAIKKFPLRCYLWYSSNHINVIFVSHYIHKDYKKLAQREIDRVCENWHTKERE